jgi:predicted transglutaminase-like cysteine proteinase
MPTYTKNVSAFTKWAPIKAWLIANTAKIKTTQPTVLACDKINKKVNKSFVYQRDGIKDTWFTPTQFVTMSGGDCEDFCIYKMSKLPAEGVALENTELVICIDKKSREYHCVLRVFDGAQEYILDNQNIMLLNKSSFNERYQPIYAIGVQGWRNCTN